MVKRTVPAAASKQSAGKKAQQTEEPASILPAPIAKVAKKAKDAVVAVAEEVAPALTKTTKAKGKEVKEKKAKPDLQSEMAKGKAVAEAKHGEEASAVASSVSKKRKTAEDFMDVEPTTTAAPSSKKAKTASTSTATITTTASASEPAPAAESTSKPLKSALKKSGLSKPPTPSTRTQPSRTNTTKSSTASTSNPSKAAYIAGFSSSESGSDDESDDDEDVDMDGGAGRARGEDKRRIDVKTLPTVAKDDKTVARKLEKAKRKNDKQRGVLYLGRIPHGFYEEEMKSYFSQFGDVTRLRLSRNKKTGASKHYAYIEFNSKSVAEITADTMNNYLLMGHILQCHIIPNDEVHPDLFIGANRKYQAPPAELQAMRLKTLKTGDEKVRARANARLVKRDEKRQEKIKGLGIDYEFKL